MWTDVNGKLWSTLFQVSSTWKFSNKILAEHTRKGSAIILQPLASFTTRDLDFSIIKTAYY